MDWLPSLPVTANAKVKTSHTKRARWAVVALLFLIAAGTIGGLKWYASRVPVVAADLEAPGPFQNESKRIRPLHETKRPPAPSDWLATKFERGQSFAQYQRSQPNRATEQRQFLFLQPLGEFQDRQRELIRQTADLMTRYFNLTTNVLPPLELDSMPAWAKRNQQGQTQLLTSYLLGEVLKPRRPENAVAVLGLTTIDLWPGEDWNYVFGQASLDERVGVWSLSRYGDPNGDDNAWSKYRERTFKVAVHETGHMLGMPHCIYYECLMNGSNHLREMDSRPFWLCPECVRKVWWNCGANPAQRYASLLEFSKQHGMPSETGFWHQSALRVR